MQDNITHKKELSMEISVEKKEENRFRVEILTRCQQFTFLVFLAPQRLEEKQKSDDF